MKNNKKVVVAVSGGVDSSLAAALLLEQGYEVIAVYMEMLPLSSGNHGHLSKGARDAQRVAESLNIPFHVLDVRQLFEQKVISLFVNEYVSGRTPNPCIACNRFIKFGVFIKNAVDLGADYVATGHYARITYDSNINRYCLKKAADERKDQTYVLYNLSQEQLSRTLFPLGGFSKEEVRRMAVSFGIVTADRPESQEICFIPDNDYHRFLRERAGDKIKPGSFVDLEGKVLGIHKGVPFYTVGQRKGLGLAMGEPVYVVSLDSANNSVVLGRNQDVFSQGLISSDNNFILYEKIDKPVKVKAKIRYSAKPAEALITPLDGDNVKVVFENPQRAVTPGQAVVYYQGEYVVGGGTITKPLND